MSYKNLTLGERLVMAARFMATEHVRQEADAAGIDLTQLARRTPGQRVEATEVASIRQDLFRQPADAATAVDADADDDRRAA